MRPTQQEQYPLPHTPLRLPVTHAHGVTLLRLRPLYDAVSAHPDDAAPLVVAVDGPGVNALTLAAALFAKLVDWRRPQLDLYIARPRGEANGHGAHSAGTENGRDYADADADANADDVNGADDADADADAVVVVGPDGPPDPFLAHAVVAVGGTFDRLHAGHRLLLCAAAWAARECVRVGVTGPELLSGKAHARLIGSVSKRCEAATRYVRRARAAAGLEAATVLASVLRDRAGPAASEPLLHGLVVSHETLAGAPRINEHRAALGLAPLAVVVVPVLGGKAGKLSSSALREADARAAAAAEPMEDAR